MLFADAVANEWQSKGDYLFSNWKGPSLGVYYSIPSDAGKNTPILIVMPGARRNAADYRDSWHKLALTNDFIVLAVAANVRDFPDEYAYNAGGVITAKRKLIDEASWVFSAIEPLFNDFRGRFESERQSYSIYGHSAGGQFVLGFLLLKPEARVDVAIAANPAFCPLPDRRKQWPFGLRGLPLPKPAVDTWLETPLVVLLGDQDLQPRNRRLSNGPLARAQGPHVFARGLNFFNSALQVSDEREVPVRWKLEIVQGVGHNSAKMAPHAIKYLPR